MNTPNTTGYDMRELAAISSYENEGNPNFQQEAEEKEYISGPMAEWIRLNDYLMHLQRARKERKRCG